MGWSVTKLARWEAIPTLRYFPNDTELALAWPCWNCTGSYKFSVSVKKMGEGWTGGASDIVKAKGSGEDPRATGGLVSNLPRPRVNKAKQHYCLDPVVPEKMNRVSGLSEVEYTNTPATRGYFSGTSAGTFASPAGSYKYSWEISRIRERKKPEVDTKKIRGWYEKSNPDFVHTLSNWTVLM